MTENFELRGWRKICEFIGCKDEATAKKKLKRMNILAYDGNKPVLNTVVYQKASLRRWTK